MGKSDSSTPDPVMPVKKIRVEIFDDHPVVRDNLEMLVDGEEDMVCAGTFRDCTDVLKKIEKTNPDVILMDIRMPGVDGIEGVRQIRSRFPGLKILMQSIFEDEQKVFEAICSGASGYILKKSTAAETLKAIRDTYNGGASMSPVVAAKVLEKFRAEVEVPAVKPDELLTARETEILVLLSKGKSYKMIAGELGISFYTVDSHLRKVYEKLQVHSMTEALAIARRRKLLHFF